MSHTTGHDIGRGRCAHAAARPVLSVGLLLAVAGGTVSAGVDCDGDGIPDPAQTYIWRSTLPTGAAWENPANWASPDGGVPGVTDLAVFDGASGLGLPPYTAFLNGFTPVKGLDVLDVDTTIRLGGNRLSVVGQVEGCRELFVGGALGSTLTIDGQGGTLSTRRVRVGDQGPSSLKIGDAFHEHISQSPLVIGSAGEGSLEYTSSTLIHDGSLTIADKVGSRGEVVASAGSLLAFGVEVGASLLIGNEGRGSLLVTDGSVIQNGTSPTGVSIALGFAPGSDGQLRLPDGDVTHWMPVTMFRIGVAGEGLFEIGDTVTVDMPTPNAVLIAEGRESLGEARVLGGGLWRLDAPALEVGLGGSGRLTLGEGGVADVAGVVRASKDGTVRGSGTVLGTVVLRGGAVRPSAQFATTGARQQLRITGNLVFSAPRPGVSEEDTGRLIFTLRSPDPSETMSVAVDGEAVLGGTLRVRVNPGVEPEIGVLYPAVESGQLTGRFAAVQSPAASADLIAQAVYPGDGNAYVRFDTSTVPGPDLDPPVVFGISAPFRDGKLEDVNKDGFPDLVAPFDVGGGGPGRLLVAFNQGVGSGGQWNGFDVEFSTFSTAGVNPVSIDLGDMNQDGLPDVVVANRDESAQQIRILLNDPSNLGDFSTLDNRSVTLPGSPVDLTLADINGSGRLDIVSVYDPFFTRGSGGGINTSEDDGGGGFDDSDGDTGDDPGSVDSMGGAVQPNGIAATSKSESSVYTYGTGAASGSSAAPRGLFPLVQLQRLPAGRDPEDLFTADLNGDGLDEIITSDALSGSISVQIATSGDEGMTIYGPGISLRASEAEGGGQPESVVAVDLNGDSRLDIAYIASNENGGRRVFGIVNLGRDDSEQTLLFSRPRQLDVDGASGPAPTILAVADVDQNGRDDLVSLAGLGAEGAQGVSAYLAAGTPCNAADLALPFGVLDLSDLNVFVAAFVSQDLVADIAPPFGILDLSDVNAFVGAFVAGCP
jgi:hypothetical protein